MRLVTSVFALSAIFQAAEAGLWNRGAVKPRSESFQASSFAGATTSAIFPPPGATDTSVDSLFPSESEVGFPGPTPSAYAIRMQHSIKLTRHLK